MPLFIERAKSGRAACRKCDKHIADGTLRVAFPLYLPMEGTWAHQYVHVKCWKPRKKDTVVNAKTFSSLPDDMTAEEETKLEAMYVTWNAQIEKRGKEDAKRAERKAAEEVAKQQRRDQKERDRIAKIEAKAAAEDAAFRALHSRWNWSDTRNVIGRLPPQLAGVVLSFAGSPKEAALMSRTCRAWRHQPGEEYWRALCAGMSPDPHLALQEFQAAAVEAVTKPPKAKGGKAKGKGKGKGKAKGKKGKAAAAATAAAADAAAADPDGDAPMIAAAKPAAAAAAAAAAGNDDGDDEVKALPLASSAAPAAVAAAASSSAAPAAAAASSSSGAGAISAANGNVASVWRTFYARIHTDTCLGCGHIVKKINASHWRVGRIICLQCRELPFYAMLTSDDVKRDYAITPLPRVTFTLLQRTSGLEMGQHGGRAVYYRGEINNWMKTRKYFTPADAAAAGAMADDDDAADVHVKCAHTRKAAGSKRGAVDDAERRDAKKVKLDKLKKQLK